jgi:hypothetical protein
MYTFKAQVIHQMKTNKKFKAISQPKIMLAALKRAENIKI